MRIYLPATITYFAITKADKVAALFSRLRKSIFAFVPVRKIVELAKKGERKKKRGKERKQTAKI